MRILIVDNNIDRPLKHCVDFRRYLEGEVVVRRGPERDLPSDPSEFTHIILTGSRASCLDSDPWIRGLIDFVIRVGELGVPLLGVCYGHQIVARAFGGDQTLQRASLPEFGWVEVRQKYANPILKGLGPKFFSFQAHFEEVARLPEGFVCAADTERCAIQAYCHESKPIFGVQFHPERNLEEGRLSLESRKKELPKDCIFNASKAGLLFSENVGRIIFRNFIASRGPKS